MSDVLTEGFSESEFTPQLQRLVTVVSLGWLLAANAVGVWLALILWRPEWGAIAGDYTYGKWVEVHLDWQLYGWCSLPIVGLLLKRFVQPGPRAVAAVRLVLGMWSLALLAGAVSWLQGETSGKLFLDWQGWPRLVFLGNLALLWWILVSNRVKSRRNRPPDFSARWFFEGALLLILATVPPLLYWSSGRNVYPAIDPGTGGPTGASLLGSTLVIVLLIAALPEFLDVPPSGGSRRHFFWIWFGLNCIIFMVLRHGNSSHRDWHQIGALGSLLTWVPALGWYLRSFRWSPAARLWLLATQWWWAVLVISGFCSFLPGVLDRMKFTHALVAHAHLAMAGLLTSMNMMILIHLAPTIEPAAAALCARGPFVAWQGGLGLHLAALGWLASAEIAAPGTLFTGGGQPAYLVRLLAGLLMAGASAQWALSCIGDHDHAAEPALPR